MKKQYQTNVRLVVNLLVSIIILLLCIFVLPKVLVFFLPFVIGWVISCMANPLVQWLEHKIKIRRKAGTVVVIILTIAAIVSACYLAISILARQLTGFLGDVPQMWDNLYRDMTHFGNMLSRYVNDLPQEWTETLNQVGNLIGDTLTSFVSNAQSISFAGVGSVVGNIAGIIISVIMCLLSSYLFIADRDYVHRLAERLIPRTVREKYDVFYRSIRQAVGGYFKAQFFIEIRIYILILFGLTILRVDYSLLIALVIAFLDFLPFFGSGAVFWPWAVIKVLGGDYFRAVGFMVIWGVGQLVRQFIQPKIMGDSIGMEPIPTLVLLFIGYRVSGVIGMILAVPIAIIIVNMNEAGIFDTPKLSLKLLLTNLNEYRRLTREDLKSLPPEDRVNIEKEIKERETREQEQNR